MITNEDVLHGLAEAEEFLNIRNQLGLALKCKHAYKLIKKYEAALTKPESIVIKDNPPKTLSELKVENKLLRDRNGKLFKNLGVQTNQVLHGEKKLNEQKSTTFLVCRKMCNSDVEAFNMMWQAIRETDADDCERRMKDAYAQIKAEENKRKYVLGWSETP